MEWKSLGWCGIHWWYEILGGDVEYLCGMKVLGGGVEYSGGMEVSSVERPAA